MNTLIQKPPTDFIKTADEILSKVTLKVRSHSIQPHHDSNGPMEDVQNLKVSHLEKAPIAHNDAQVNILKQLGFEKPEKMNRTMHDWAAQSKETDDFLKTPDISTKLPLFRADVTAFK